MIDQETKREAETKPSPEFIKGIELAESFYHKAAKPILEAHFPDLRYSAALIGTGSRVLEYDDATSSDHHWGPRFLLFLFSNDYAQYGKEISITLSEHLPHYFRGCATSFGSPGCTMLCELPLRSPPRSRPTTRVLFSSSTPSSSPRRFTMRSPTPPSSSFPPRLGSVDQYVDSTDALNYPQRFKPLYLPKE